MLKSNTNVDEGDIFTIKPCFEVRTCDAASPV